MTRKHHSTSTLVGDEVVPWLATKGELAYSPHNPPDKDYYFQYSWIMPQIFNPNGFTRRHYWFGEPDKKDLDVQRLFAFWNSARRGACNEVFFQKGRITPTKTIAPIAVYRHKNSYAFQPESLIFIQHGSYLLVDIESQPEIGRGHVILYRGIQDGEIFRMYRLRNEVVRSALMKVHALTMTDSIVSFNAAHCNVVRTETEHLNDRSFMLGDLTSMADLPVDEKSVSSLLYSGYALESWCGKNKFGPNYVKFRTPADNIRITTFVCNETEVKVIDPNRVEVVQAVGCRVEEVEV